VTKNQTKKTAKWTPKAKDPGTFSVWLMLPAGPFAISHRWPGSYDAQADPRDTQVRTTRRKYLDRLRRDWLPELSEDVGLDGNTDYGHRAYVSSEDLARGMARMALGVDACGFKDHALDADLHDVYSSCWSAVVRLEDQGPYKPWTPKAGKTYARTPRPQDCERLGEHYWNHHAGTATCLDCGARRYWLPKTASYRHSYPKGSVRLAAKAA
jgi:hypothetical protein